MDALRIRYGRGLFDPVLLVGHGKILIHDNLSVLSRKAGEFPWAPYTTWLVQFLELLSVCLQQTSAAVILFMTRES